MKIENQVCTLEQAKRLSQLGIRQGLSIFFWDDYAGKTQLMMNSTPKDGYEPDKENTCFSAFTVAELGMMLPPSDISKGEFTNFSKGVNGLSWSVDCSLWDAPGFPIDGEPGPTHHYTEAECRAEMLIILLEKRLITVEEVNQRLQAG